MARLLPLLAACGLSACVTTKAPVATLGDLDRPMPNARSAQGTKPTASSGQDAKEAYYRYIRSAPENASTRNMALARLADLELAESHQLVEQSDYQEDKRYHDTLKRTVALINTALNEFPEAEGNDRKLYQLARSYDQLGRHDEAQGVLQQLAREHPSSSLYPEAQFRLAENAFSRGDYMQAEVAYTAALHSSQDTGFHERALFKRGWARYKQSLFEQALQDFVAVIHAQKFDRRNQLEQKDQTLYEEYYRSLGLAMLGSSRPEQLASQLHRHGMTDLYPAFRSTSQLLQQQGRMSDAVAQWQHFLRAEPQGWSSILARAEMVSLWRQGGFHEQALSATEALYQEYTQQISSLPNNQDSRAVQSRELAREHWKTAAQNQHARYQKEESAVAFTQAQAWYQRYLEHFDGYAQKDGIALAYGDLLAEAGQARAAFSQYERAAFDGQVILNPEAAYAAIALLNELTGEEQSTDLLDRYIRYTRAFVQLYPLDERTPTMALGAAQRAFHRERYDAAAQLSQAVMPQADESTRIAARQLLVQSHLNRRAYADAERAATQLLSLSDLPLEIRRQGEELQALSVYRQGEAAEQAGEWNQAIDHYRRIHDLAPGTDNAANGFYNALALAAEQEQWPRAIGLMEQFQQAYPTHDRRTDVERQLTQAYIATGQTDQAARQYEQLAQSEQDDRAQRAAQWKAAELYDERQDIEQAINAYRRYAHSYPQPYAQRAEAMHKLIGLYEQTGEGDKRQFWERKLLQADRGQLDDQKTQRTSHLAAQAALSLGQFHLENFAKTRLSLPLDQSLNRKTEQMQNAIRHFATASSYGFADIASEATHRIGGIYETLAKDLLDSDRPPELSGEELVQYDILLEDRAFPFEDKAIEFYERNLLRARDEGFNDWMAQSRERLEILFPVRYSRKPKAGFYVGAADQLRGTDQSPGLTVQSPGLTIEEQ